MTVDVLSPDVSDHDLLLGGVADAVAENRAGAQKWLRLLTYYRRREADDHVRYARAPHFALTARQQTVAEVGELWGMAPHRARSQLNVVLILSEHFPVVWELCLQGQCDSYRASMIADLARDGLATPGEIRALGRRLESFLRKHLRVVPGLEELCGVDAVVSCTPKQLRNKLSYEIKRLRSTEAEARFRQAHARRDASVVHGEDGVSWLTVEATTDQAAVAMRRLTLAAQRQRGQGDPRTVAQLRADLAMDLLIGREPGVPVPTYARPVVNLTVPIQTVMGIGDAPGVLSGGRVVPAGLARMIAQDPDATWHRMLTDPAGHLVELSTRSYRPTRAIWEQVVAEHGTCYRPGCDTPATEAELDHRLAWPAGDTVPENLWPACKSDHKAKHAPGFRIAQTDNGSFTLETPAGFSHEISRSVHPVDDDWADPTGIQHSATELLEGLAYLREQREEFEIRGWATDWEHDLGDWEWELTSQTAS